MKPATFTGALVAAALLAGSGLAAGGCSSRPACHPAAGGRCAGKEPIRAQLTVDRSGTRLHGIFQCGGTLTAKETDTRVTVTYLASAVGPGAMSCALVPLEVALRRPLGDRTVIDAATHQPIAVAHAG